MKEEVSFSYSDENKDEILFRRFYDSSPHLNIERKIHQYSFRVDKPLSDTGILPVEGSGLLQLQETNRYICFAYQVAPKLHTIQISNAEVEDTLEHDKYDFCNNSGTFKCEYPWTIIIGLIEKNQSSYTFIGAKMFFSTENIVDGTEQFYIPPIPNINASQYPKTSLGWLCLYPQNFSGPLNQAISKTLETCFNSPFNANMTESDGHYLYHRYFENHPCNTPESWAQASKDNPGFLLNDDLLLPAYVESLFNQNFLSNINEIYWDESLEFYNKLSPENIRKDSFTKEDYINSLFGIPLNLLTVMNGNGFFYYKSPNPIYSILNNGIIDEFSRKLDPKSLYEDQKDNFDFRHNLSHQLSQILNLYSDYSQIHLDSVLIQRNQFRNLKPVECNIHCAISGETLSLKDAVPLYDKGFAHRKYIGNKLVEIKGGSYHYIEDCAVCLFPSFGLNYNEYFFIPIEAISKYSLHCCPECKIYTNHTREGKCHRCYNAEATFKISEDSKPKLNISTIPNLTSINYTTTTDSLPNLFS